MSIKRNSIIAVIFILILLLGMVFIMAKYDLILQNIIKEVGLNKRTSYNISEQISLARDNIENQIDNRVTKIKLLRDINGMFQKIINRKIIHDVDPTRTVYKLSNNQLCFNFPNYDIEYCVENLVELKNYLQEKNVNLLYVQAPHKINKYNSLLPPGVEDTTNKNADKFLKGIAKNGVDIYDLREVIKENQTNYNNLFYDTDHHWKVETAFWAYTNVAKYISSKYKIDLSNYEMMNINSFEQVSYKKFFLGSLGRRVSSTYSGYDDFTVLFPKFETDYDLTIFKNETDSVVYSGPFDQTIISSNQLNPKIIDANRYGVYFDQDYPEIKVHNKKIKGNTILIIQDSFGLPFSAFISLVFEHTDVLDLRYMRYKTLFKHLDKNHYDLVLFLYSPSVFSKKDEEYQFIFK